MSNKKEQHEGENLREILIVRYGTLEKAAKTINVDYAYLTKQVKQAKQKPKYLLKIAELLDIDPDEIRGIQKAEPPAPAWSSEKEEMEYYRTELERMRDKYTRLLEDHVKILQEKQKPE